MANNEEKLTPRTQTPDEPQSKEQVLVFSHQLRRDIEPAASWITVKDRIT